MNSNVFGKIKNKNILVTGGTGTFGKKFIETIIYEYNPNKIIVFSRDEMKQYKMQQSFPDDGNFPIRYFLGDVRDKQRLIMASKNVDIIIHAAALKQNKLDQVERVKAQDREVNGGA